MFRGTTPTIFLDLEDFDTEEPVEMSLQDIVELWVTFKSPTVEITKTLEDVSINDETKSIMVHLSQEETLKLFQGLCDVQVRFRKQNNLAYATTIDKVDVERILKEGVI